MSDTIKVEIGGKKYDTYIDENGVQRFEENPLLRKLVNLGKISLNDLAVEYEQGEFTQREYLEFYMSIGYSVDGIAELSMFKDLRIKNPIWDKNREPTEDYNDKMSQILT